MGSEVLKRVDAPAMAGGEQVMEMLQVLLATGDGDKVIRGTWVLRKVFLLLYLVTHDVVQPSLLPETVSL